MLAKELEKTKKKRKKKKKELTPEQKKINKEAKILLDYFVLHLSSIPRLVSWYGRNMKHCKDLVTVYTLDECKGMVDSIFQDSFWKDKVDSFAPLIKAPHKWLSVTKPKKSNSVDEETYEIEQYIWYEIFKGDPLDNIGRSTEANIREALEQYEKGQKLEDIYTNLRKRVRK